MKTRDDLAKAHESLKEPITERLGQFRRTWEKGSDKEIFMEMAFCLFTPQSKAFACWDAVKMLDRTGLLWTGSKETIADSIKCVRFRNNKAGYLVEARKQFYHGNKSIRNELGPIENPLEKREHLVKAVKGMGMKEATHFLRNTGQSGDLAMLDRHILKNLVTFGVIKEMPSGLSKKEYEEVEERMLRFSKETAIPMDHLDLLFWHSETGEIFK